jgi:methylenetetrahydrofolate reductase (NADPH)
MKVLEHIQQAKDTQVSFEILPPLKGKTINSIYDHLDPLMEFKPAFINVTYHRSETMFKKKKDGTFEKVEIRKRPGTVGICAAIMNHYQVDAVPHLICGGFTKRETEDALIFIALRAMSWESIPWELHPPARPRPWLAYLHLHVVVAMIIH